MVEIELQLTEDFGDDLTILERHVHSHEKNGRNKVHAHDVCKKQDNNGGGLGRRDGIEELCEGDEQAADWCDDDDTNQDEGDVLGPKDHVQVQAQEMDSDLEATSHRVRAANTVKQDVNDAHENFIHTVDGEEVTKKVEVSAL